MFTEGNKGLQIIRNCYKWLRGVTKGYKGYKGLQGVTKGYKGLQRVKRG